MPQQNEFNLTVNQIGPWGKFLGGALLIIFTALAITSLFAFWPDKIPDIKETADNKYTFTLFAIRLIKDSVCHDTTKAKEAVKEKETSKEKKEVSDSTGAKQTVPKTDTLTAKRQENPCIKHCDTIDLNTIFLILVAITGFLGNMIHIATSFTTYIGNEDFKRSWITWYFVKPLTAAALAIIIYFIVRAGFLSYGSDAKNISLYGILSLSALAGLFTDTATLKLKEIFETIFKPKDERNDKLDALKIDSIVPEILIKGVNNLSLTGKGFDGKKLTIKINNQVIPNLSIVAGSIGFSYTVAETAASQTQFQLSVFDDSNKEIFRKQLTVQ